MIKHIVMFKLKTKDIKEKNARINELKNMLDSLKQSIQEIKLFETGINICTRPTAYDLVLISEFETKDALQRYIEHPDHQNVVDYLNKIKESTVVVDYEI